MYELAGQNEEALNAQLAKSRQRLDALVQDLNGIDGELEELATERHQHQLLRDLCTGLDELRELGAAELFWGPRVPGFEPEEHLRRVRTRVDAFEKRLDEIELRRQAVVEELDRAQESTELLEDDLLELKHQEEERKLEWVIEREVDSFPIPPMAMPWARGDEADQRFRRSLLIALLLSLLLGLLIPMIDLPLPEAWEPVEVPERFTRLIQEEIPPPPPPPVQEQKPPEELQKESSDEPKLAKKKEEKPKTSSKPKTASKGILAFREKFSSLAEGRPAAKLGAQARIRGSGNAATGRPQRALVATQAPGSSGGIDIGTLSRDVGNGGEGIGGVEVTQATSSIGAIAGEERPLSEGPGPARTDEEIQIVFDRHKAALYRLYNRELRRDPTLKGQLVLRLRIEPDGSVSLCELQSSDMDAPQLASQVVGRVKTFDFGPKEGVTAITILYPIDFLPAT